MECPRPFHSIPSEWIVLDSNQDGVTQMQVGVIVHAKQ